jgi:hypothetical protein
VSAAQIAQWIYDNWWAAPLPPGIWFLQRTRIARTIVRGEVRDRWLRAKGVPAADRRKLAVDALRLDLESS